LAKVVDKHKVPIALLEQISTNLSNLAFAKAEGHRSHCSIKLSLWQAAIAHMIEAREDL
jgi:hypothetical protein